MDQGLNSKHIGNVGNVARAEAKEACGSEQLCVGSEAGIKGGIHIAQQAWKDNK